MLREVKTKYGVVRGLPAADPRITSFKGIPFAAPPVGKNRWRAPQPCEPWEGVFLAYEFGPIAMQDTPGLGTDIYCKEWHVDPDVPMDEDCLQLNIWTNAKTGKEKMPVMVWFFGGALQWGYPSEMEFDGERIARRDIVVVTINYRLNAFGFLAHPEITKEQPDTPANFGNLDQQAAVRWVVENIENFGGDPKNITICGQSAGGGSVISQVACKDNEGLFQKAVCMSGMIRDPYGEPFIGIPEPLESAEKKGESFFEFLGVKNLEEARALDATFIRNKYGEFAQSNPRMFTVLDGKFHIGDPLKVIADGKHCQVPIMAGNTTDEFLNFIQAKDEKELEEKICAIFGDKSEEFLALPETKKPYGDDAFAAVSGIECSVKSTFLQNEEKKTATKGYYYCFDADIPGEDNPGTFHSVDLWFFFETLAKCWRPFVGKDYDLARMMCNYLCNFIKTGDPNGNDIDGTPMPQWDPYTKEDPACMQFKTDNVHVTHEKESDFMSICMDMVQEQLNK